MYFLRTHKLFHVVTGGHGGNHSSVMQDTATTNIAFHSTESAVDKFVL